MGTVEYGSFSKVCRGPPRIKERNTQTLKMPVLRVTIVKSCSTAVAARSSSIPFREGSSRLQSEKTLVRPSHRWNVVGKSPGHDSVTFYKLMIHKLLLLFASVHGAENDTISSSGTAPNQ
jgi:hypothetical protein